MRASTLAARAHAARQRIMLALPELAVRFGIESVSLPTSKDPVVATMLQLEAVADFMDAALASLRVQGEGVTGAGAASTTGKKRT